MCCATPNETGEVQKTDAADSDARGSGQNVSFVGTDNGDEILGVCRPTGVLL